MSKKIKTVTLEDLGEVTLSALSVGWLEENGDAIAKAPQTTRDTIQTQITIIHASLRKRHPGISPEELRDKLDFGEISELAETVMILSKLKKEATEADAGEAIPENPSRASSSES